MYSEHTGIPAIDRVIGQIIIDMKDDEEVRSECCGAKIYDDTDICSDCLEHC